MLVDNAAPITFRDFAKRIAARGLTPASYKRKFRIPLDYKDIVNPSLADEIVAYRCLIEWYRNGRKSLQTARSA